MATPPVPAYPVRVDAQLDSRLSRWLWLVKWVLVIPHYIVLAFLWIAFAVLSVVAFFAIVFTGRYPMAIFTFNSGVLRWSWRVAYYAYGALGTDRYPPFSLRDVPDYPAHFDVAYPEHLSRGLVWVKWWLLAIPQYIVVGFFVGGGWWFADHNDAAGAAGVGLIGVLVFFAGVSLLFRGRYPASIFDIVLGLNRWALRVAAYAALMTDRYPPFRLDQGGVDPGSAPPPQPPVAPPAGELPPPQTGAPWPPATPPPPPPSRQGWTAGRVVAVVVGSMVIIGSLGGLVAGIGGLAVDRYFREDGFLTSVDREFSTRAPALVSEDMDFSGLDSPGDRVFENLVGNLRVRVTAADDRAVFVGIAPTDEVARYLAGRMHTTVTDPAGDPGYTLHRGRPVIPSPVASDAAGIWAAQATGTGTQTVEWTPTEGHWAIVVMRPSGVGPVDVTADMGAEVPVLPAASFVVGALSLLGLAAGVALVAIAVRRAGTRGSP